MAERASRCARLRVAGATLRVRAPAPHPGLRLPRRLSPFAPTRGADLRLELCEAAPPIPADGSLLFESGGLWRVHEHEARRLYSIHDRTQLKPSRAALVTPDWTEGTVFVPPGPDSGRPGFVLGYPLDELAFRDHLANTNGFVLHAAAVLLRGRALLFVGHSGTGKSTTAEIWHRGVRGASILSDDRVAIRIRRGIPRAWGTPWHGSGRWALPDSAPIAGLFLLERAGRTSLELLTAAAARAELFARAFPPLWDATAVAQVLGAVDATVAATPTYRLRQRLGRGAVAAVLEAVGR